MTAPIHQIGTFPPAPDTLPTALHGQWDATVRAYAADYFRGADLPLLAELLRAQDMAEKLGRRIDATDDVDEMAKLLKLRDMEARRAATLATKLRLAPQSRSDRHLAGRMARDAGGSRPWETNEFDQFADPGDRYFRKTKSC